MNDKTTATRLAEAQAELTENTGILNAIRRQRDSTEATLRDLTDRIVSSHDRVIDTSGRTGVPVEDLLRILREHGHPV